MIQSNHLANYNILTDATAKDRLILPTDRNGIGANPTAFASKADEKSDCTDEPRSRQRMQPAVDTTMGAAVESVSLFSNVIITIKPKERQVS